MDAPEQFIAAYNDRDWGRLREALADDCVYEQIGRPKRRAESAEEVVDVFRAWAQTAAEAEGEIENRVSGEDGIVLELILHGPKRPPFGDFTPAGKRQSVRAALVFRLDERGRIRSLRNYFDSLVLYQVLGIQE